jgi:hypothetical protein
VDNFDFTNILNAGGSMNLNLMDPKLIVLAVVVILIVALLA